MNVDSEFKITTNLELVVNKNIYIINISGFFSNDNSHLFYNQINTIIDNKNYNIILSLQDLSYIDSSCIFSILKLHRTLIENGGFLVIANPSLFVLSIFDMTDLSSYFTIKDSLELAKACFI